MMLELRCINNRHCIHKIIVSRGLRRKMNLIVCVQKKTTNSTWYFVVTRSSSTFTSHLVYFFMPKYIRMHACIPVFFGSPYSICIFTLLIFFTFIIYRLFRILFPAYTTYTCIILNIITCLIVHEYKTNNIRLAK